MSNWYSRYSYRSRSALAFQEIVLDLEILAETDENRRSLVVRTQRGENGIRLWDPRNEHRTCHREVERVTRRLVDDDLAVSFEREFAEFGFIVGMVMRSRISVMYEEIGVVWFRLEVGLAKAIYRGFEHKHDDVIDGDYANLE